MHARTLALTRAAVLRTLTETCAIQAQGARVADSHGGYATTYATKTGQSAVKCLAVSPKPQDVALFAEIGRASCRGRL